MSRKEFTLGILGGGQLGRMFTSAARTMGYDVVVLDPDPEAPAAHFASRHLCAPFTDAIALNDLARSCSAVTTEFENAPASSLDILASEILVRPAAQAVAIAQNRIFEKTFFKERGIAVGDFAVARCHDSFERGLLQVGLPAIIKTARFGYDGKGQYRVDTLPQAMEILEREADMLPVVIEALLPLDLEISVILARSAKDQLGFWPVAENQHRHGILDMTIAPARISEALAQQARDTAATIARQLDYVGVLAVEFFVSQGRLLVNEMAPRPHNSGHYTLDACITSQFEQQVRMLAGLPAGSTEQLRPAVMVNILGELWAQGTPPWSLLFAEPEVKLHLYGKQEPRPGRKMGHFTVLGSTVEQALCTAERLRRVFGIY